MKIDIFWTAIAIVVRRASAAENVFLNNIPSIRAEARSNL
jgi:hypothetical protein